jgi:putative FmdB family regulatory protein
LASKGKEEEVMPAYEYKCTGACEGTVLKVRSIKDNDPGYDCETCNLPLERVYSNFGVVLNGSGFYSTDNRKR